MTVTARPERIGFFGTGIMGAPMARNLLRSGFQLAVWNRTPAKYAELVNEGATAPGTPRAVAAISDVVISMLVEPEHLDAILHGPEGILAGVKPGSTFIDMSTGPPRVARRLTDLFAQRSVAALDAPVRGGVGSAVDGSLMVMAGGEKATFERALPVLEAIGKTVIYAGPTGSGRIAKTAHQLVAAATIQAVAEALALAKEFGADQTGVREVLLKGASATPMLKAESEKMIARDWKAGLPLWVFLKDAVNMDDTLSGTGLKLPVGQATFDRIRQLVQNGQGDLDASALYTLLDP